MALPSGGDSDAALADAHEAIQDALLVGRVRRGDTDAYGRLVSRHMRRAFTIAYRVLEQREDAEDVVQDSFMRALERIDQLEHGRPFRPWFFRIVVNQALNNRRRRAVRATDQIPESARSRQPSPELAADRALLRDRLQLALEALPEKQRTIVQLADLEDFTSAEIGVILDMADGTVRWHLHQARRALRESLGMLKEET